ncbi:MAG: membrane protein insertase YidC [Thermomicrobiales bacterium]|nr:membrane protein insertase YidC [Thermomicrobiales bacterium]
MLDITSSLGTMVPGIIIWDQYVGFLKWFLNELANIFHNGGIAIIVFTIIVKTLMLPLTIKSIRSSKAMQELQPKIKEIQKKHGNDRQAASAAQMALYQQYGVNPMAGCLPMLIQMPIFFGIYRAIYPLADSGLGHWADGFLWIPDLAQPDPIHILPLLAGLFQFIQARMMRPANQVVTDPQQKMMNTMMNFMPLTVIAFGWGFGSGPVLYWAAQAVYSVVQQWLITGWGAFGEWFPWLPELPEHRRLGYIPPRPLDELVVQSGEPVKKSRFTQFMEAQQEKARQQQEAAQKRRDEAAAAQKPTRTTSPQGPAKSAKRSDYQSRVDAATKYAAKTDGDVIDVESTPVQQPTGQKKKKR